MGRRTSREVCERTGGQVKTAATSARDAASRARRIRARETPARTTDATRAVRAPLRAAADHAIICTFSESAEREVEHPNRETPNNLSPALSVYPRGYVRPGNAGLFHWKSNTMKTTSTSRKAQTAAAKSATDTTTDNAVGEYERKYPTGVTSEQRKARAARFENHAAKIVAKMSGHDRALLDAAAESVGMDAAALVAWQLTEERGLGKRRDYEAEFNRWIDDTYEAQTTLRRNNHEKEVATTTAAVYGLFGPAGLTDAEEVEVVRRFFRKGDRSLSRAEGRAIKAALAVPSPNDAEPITYADSGKDLTIRISGTAYANLAAMAKTMNGVDWCDNDNTPATVASNFVIGDIIGDLAEPTRMSRNIVCGGCGEIALYIVESIDTGCDGETNEHKRRVEELRTALLAALLTARETSGANV